MPRVTSHAEVVTHMNFAVQHLLAATHFALASREIEQKNAGKPFGPHFDELLWTVSACVLASVAGLEAYANEVFVDRAGTLPEVNADIADKMWELSERRPVLEKFDAIHRLCGIGPLDRGSREAQDVSALVTLRNGLTHFKPQWDSEQATHAKISRLLEGRFEPSALIADKPTFPRRWACSSCARWAVATARDFLLTLEASAGLPSKVGKHQDKMQP
jgi:hypothetical protein